MGRGHLPSCMGWQGLDAVLTARVGNIADVLITQATISAIAYKTINTDQNDQVDGTGTFEPVDVIYDTEQTADGFWPHVEGWNFRATIPGAKLPGPDTNYEIQILLTPTGGASDIMVAGEIHTRKVH